MPDPRPLTQVGQRISARRKQLGMNRAAFAEATNVSESSIARIERGKEVRASTYLAVTGYLQRRYSLEAVAERMALLSDAARERVLELIRRFEDRS
ncbi:MAG TPA: helix-turn-helix domain-containing protein [Enhygromyxa sp.]|nr:helix-turn-helix domain-containing protein [Enhygromyxa sp.]